MVIEDQINSNFEISLNLIDGNIVVGATKICLVLPVLRLWFCAPIIVEGYLRPLAKDKP